jgi:hypothetical protein
MKGGSQGGQGFGTPETMKGRHSANDHPDQNVCERPCTCDTHCREVPPVSPQNGSKLGLQLIHACRNGVGDRLWKHMAKLAQRPRRRIEKGGHSAGAADEGGNPESGACQAEYHDGYNRSQRYPVSPLTPGFRKPAGKLHGKNMHRKAGKDRR